MSTLCAKYLRVINLSVIICGVIFFLAWMISGATLGGSVLEWLSYFIAMLCFSFWIALPYLLPAILAWFLLKHWFSQALLLILVIASIWLEILAFDTMDEDAQGALVLVFWPYYQLKWISPIGLFLLLLDWCIRKFLKKKRIPDAYLNM